MLWGFPGLLAFQTYTGCPHDLGTLISMGSSWQKQVGAWEPVWSSHGLDDTVNLGARGAAGIRQGYGLSKECFCEVPL